MYFSLISLHLNNLVINFEVVWHNLFSFNLNVLRLFLIPRWFSEMKNAWKYFVINFLLTVNETVNWRKLNFYF